VAAPKRFAGRTILVADDDFALRVLLQAVLQRMGASVELAADGEEAIAKLAQSPDLIVLDLRMPTVSGFEVLEHLRVHQSALLARTLVITAAPARVDVLLGDLAVLHKPFDLNVFIESLEQRLTAPVPTLPPLDDWQARLRRAPQRPTQQKGGSTQPVDEARRQRAPPHFTSETARIAGRKGGEALSRDREHMATLGRKSAQARATRATTKSRPPKP
jgi:CheY-like chemotaxis protein